MTTNMSTEETKTLVMNSRKSLWKEGVCCSDVEKRKKGLFGVVWQRDFPLRSSSPSYSRI